MLSFIIRAFGSSPDLASQFPMVTTNLIWLERQLGSYVCV